MYNKKALGAVVFLPAEESKKYLVSSYFIELFTSYPNFDYNDIRRVLDGKMSKDDMIRKVIGSEKRGNEQAYAIFYKVISQIGGENKLENDYEKYTLKSTLDIANIFNTDEKIYQFISYLMKHCLKQKERGNMTIVRVEGSFCIDYYWLLQVLEDMIVEVYSGERNEVRKYLRKRFLSYHDMFFFIMGVLKLQCGLVSMFISNYTYLTEKGSNREHLMSWSHAIYNDENGKEVYFRQVHLGAHLIENRVKACMQKGTFSELNLDLFNSFSSMIDNQKVFQIAWGKDAKKIVSNMDGKQNWYWLYGSNE